MEKLPSDFSKSLARASEGHCPLCGCRMGTSTEGAFRAYCTHCEVGWHVWFLEDGRPMLSSSRRLAVEEVAQLYRQQERT